MSCEERNVDGFNNAQLNSLERHLEEHLVFANPTGLEITKIEFEDGPRTHGPHELKVYYVYERENGKEAKGWSLMHAFVHPEILEDVEVY